MKVSDYVAKFLEEKNVKYIFGYQGGSITHLLESIDKSNIRYIQNYNEQGASFAADGYSRIADEKIGVAIASNGPGATNLITGIANAYCDSIAMLCITGQVHTWAMKGDRKVRQQSFQEIDIISMLKPITKYAVTVLKKEDIKYELEKAMFIAKEGRPGPVIVDIPVDIQGMDIEVENLKGYEKEENKKIKISEEVMLQIYDRMKSCKRPIILVGGGARQDTVKCKLREFVDKYNLPVVCSLQGLDVINHDNESFVGFIGSYGNRGANIALQNADFILVIGSRLDMRQTGKNKESFAPNAFIVHIDIDGSEIEHNVHEELSIVSSTEEFIDNLIRFEFIDKWSMWLDTVKEWNNRYIDEEYSNNLIKEIGKNIAENITITSDVGQNQMWVAQSLRIPGENISILNSGGLGAMGYSLPAAIGAYYANPKRKVIAFMGDGGIQMNIQELCLIGKEQLPIKIILLNNESLGLIREIHEKYYNNNYVGSVKGFSQPNFKLLSEAYNIGYLLFKENENIQYIIDMLNNDKPVLIDVRLGNNTYVIPELLGMNTLDKQSPYMSSEEVQLIEKEVYEIENE